MNGNTAVDDIERQKKKRHFENAGRRPSGKLLAKYRMIAMLIALGTPVNEIASHLGMSISRVYHLLSESKFVNDEISKVQGDLMEAQKFLLVSLYRKALEKLEEELECGVPTRQLAAIDRVFELLNSGGGEIRRRFGL